jgi:hypothetical protein
MFFLISKQAMFAISLGALAAYGSAGQLSRAAGPPLMPSRQVDSVSAVYEARLTGAVTGTLRGPAEFGIDQAGTRFVTTLGAYSDDGAILLSRRDGGRPAPGIYRITDDPAPEDIEVVIATGSPTRPTGVFRAEQGVVAITTASPRRITGAFEVRARGFLAADPGREDREIMARGSFTSSSTGELGLGSRPRDRQVSSLSRWPWLLYPAPEERRAD